MQRLTLNAPDTVFKQYSAAETFNWQKHKMQTEVHTLICI